MTHAVLVLNVGSSSIKFALHALPDLAAICRGVVDAVGNGTPELKATGPRRAALEHLTFPGGAADHAAVADWLLACLAVRLPDITLAAAGHRVVHGGTVFADPVIIDENVLATLERFVPLAPNHQPQNLVAIRAVQRRLPSLPQIACFDTAFHRTQPDRAQRFALPRAMHDEGIRRYGFHGLSCEYLASALPAFAGARADGRVIIAHLGNGASLSALANRRSIATTMGFTALDGLVMGTRSGALDPGVVLHLMREKRLSAEEISNLLYHHSGLLGVSGVSGDLRVLEADGGAAAEQAMDLFAYRAAREMGSLAAALGGLDVLVFSAGIGEHSASMRARIGVYCKWLGVEIDESANARHASRISGPSSAVDVFVIPTDEEIVIARAVVLLRGRR
ncbi:MAG: acetate/propionate family kinase [Rhodanobacteraceae bacterium]